MNSMNYKTTENTEDHREKLNSVYLYVIRSSVVKKPTYSND